jgi:hypothetical protein
VNNEALHSLGRYRCCSSSLMQYIKDTATGEYYPKPKHDFWGVAWTLCGLPVYVAEMSTFQGYGCPDPITGVSFKPELTRIPVDDSGSVSDNDYFVAACPSGAFIRLFND